jgi:hypothetical protein
LQSIWAVWRNFSDKVRQLNWVKLTGKGAKGGRAAIGRAERRVVAIERRFVIVPAIFPCQRQAEAAADATSQIREGELNQGNEVT